VFSFLLDIQNIKAAPFYRSQLGASPEINAISSDVASDFAGSTFSFFYSDSKFSLLLLGHEAFSGSRRRVLCFLLT